MAALLRAASPGLQAALASGVPLSRADLFSVTLADGVTKYNWAAWDSDLTLNGVLYTSANPWLTRSSWNVVNTMATPSLKVYLRALNGGFAGGASIKQQIFQGLFDGAAFLLSSAFMTPPGQVDVLGAIQLFGGEVGAVDLVGTTATLTVKGKVNKLDQNVPRNLYQKGCNHAFCDPGCTLQRSAYTAAFTVGAGATATFIPWASAPGNATNYQNGTFTLTSGAGAGQSRSIASASAAGLTLAYPLYTPPAAGDAFTGFQGCSKAFSDGSGQSCSDRSNTLNYRGYPYVPPPNSAY